MVDDASTTATFDTAAPELTSLRLSLRVVRNDANRGHGPTLRRAYELALDSGAEVVVQVDGDGQFCGADIRAVLDAVAGGARAAVGVRVRRADPWFRSALSALLRAYLRRSFGVAAADPNCPLRGYRAVDLRPMLNQLSDDVLVPNVYLTVLASRLGVDTTWLPVRHRARLGARPQGTSWGPRQRRLVVPWRLVRFTWSAFWESRAFARPSPAPFEAMSAGATVQA